VPEDQHSQKDLRWVNVGTGIITLSLSLCAIFLLIPYHVGIKTDVETGISPRLFPYIGSIGLGVFATILIIVNMISILKDRMVDEESEDKETLAFGSEEVINMLILLGSSVAYIYLMKYTGFLVASAIYTSGAMFLCGVRKMYLFLLGAIVIPLALERLLWYSLHILLPPIWFLR